MKFVTYETFPCRSLLESCFFPSYFPRFLDTGCFLLRPRPSWQASRTARGLSGITLSCADIGCGTQAQALVIERIGDKPGTSSGHIKRVVPSITKQVPGSLWLVFGVPNATNKGWNFGLRPWQQANAKTIHQNPSSIILYGRMVVVEP